MNLSRILAARKLRPNLRRTFCPESLEGRKLLSTMVAHPVADVQTDNHSVPQKGTVTGVATIQDGAITLDSAYNQVIPVSSTATGHISHLGRVTLTETHTTTILSASHYTTSSVTGGAATITAANGDKLFLTFGGPGVANAAGGFDDTFTYLITGGTGRFQGATGSGTIVSADQSVSKPFLDASGHTIQTAPFVFTLDGVISTVGSKHGHSDGPDHGKSGD